MSLVKTTQCPYCKEEILAEAVVCKHCGSRLKAQGVVRLIRSGITNGLSPWLATSQGYREFANRTSGIGEVHRIPEVSIVARPHIAGARWMTT